MIENGEWGPNEKSIIMAATGVKEAPLGRCTRNRRVFTKKKAKLRRRRNTKAQYLVIPNFWRLLFCGSARNGKSRGDGIQYAGNVEFLILFRERDVWLRSATTHSVKLSLKSTETACR